MWVGETGAPTWENELDIDALNTYLVITGKTYEQHLKEQKN